MNLHWPQYVWLLYAFLAVTTAPATHGTQRLKRNGFLTVAKILLTFGILCAGGFFTGSAS
jgi:hypothetical protein